jgi:hypothetical protein
MAAAITAPAVRPPSSPAFREQDGEPHEGKPLQREEYEIEVQGETRRVEFVDVAMAALSSSVALLGSCEAQCGFRSTFLTGTSTNGDT